MNLMAWKQTGTSEVGHKAPEVCAIKILLFFPLLQTQQAIVQTILMIDILNIFNEKKTSTVLVE